MKQFPNFLGSQCPCVTEIFFHSPLGQRKHLTLPCLCNKIQLDALFILSLFRQSTSTCFRHICSPSSGGTLYIYNNWYVHRYNAYQLLYIYSIPPDDGLQICPKHVEVEWWNKLRIKVHQGGFYYKDVLRCMVNKT